MDQLSLKRGVSIVIPCLNEAKTLAAAVQASLQGLAELHCEGEVIVADNGSSDGSQAIAERAGARVVNVKTRGYGAALHSGLQSCNYEIAVFADADLSYGLNECAALVRPIMNGEADLVVGDRIHGTIEPGAMPYLNRYLGTPVLTWLIRRLHRCDVQDCNSGFRAISVRKYRQLQIFCSGMEYASEMLIECSRRGFRMMSIPINFKKDKRDRPPHLRRWQDGWRHLRFIVATSRSSLVFVIPAIISAAMLLLALLLSYVRFDGRIKFHSSIALGASGAIILFGTLILALIRVSFEVRRSELSKFSSLAIRFADKGYLLRLFLIAILLAGFEVSAALYRWVVVTGFGDLNEIGALIRISILAYFASFLLALDGGLGLLKLTGIGNDEAANR